MFGADKGHLEPTNARLDGRKLAIGIVQARFNEPITSTLAQACRTELAALGVAVKNIDHIMVPGALEVPLALQALAEKNSYDALIALGCIIRGETYHFELVANESGAGVMRVSLDYQIPIANAILTVDTLEQAIARQIEKGRDAARVAVEMVNLLEKVA
ncbi:MAG: 6,7-dimethyl-8-ribityllumazine synthase [Curvibacter sp.]|jgi:6,7-dimethyl-8-ribityllumazine synthase|nr:6,7-dimethyl-8-ribityllumazine synthase [Curvibacter sp.]